MLSSIEAGATGYIHKDSAPDDIAQSVLQLKAGMSAISPMIARRVLSKYRSLAADNVPKSAEVQVSIDQKATKNIANDNVVSSTSYTSAQAADAESKPMLSQREQEVLELIARGFSRTLKSPSCATSAYTPCKRISKTCMPNWRCTAKVKPCTKPRAWGCSRAKPK